MDVVFFPSTSLFLIGLDFLPPARQPPQSRGTTVQCADLLYVGFFRLLGDSLVAKSTAMVVNFSRLLSFRPSLSLMSAHNANTRGKT